MQELQFIVMDFEDREQVDCLILDVFDFEDRSYIALAPEDEDDTVYIFEYAASEDSEDGMEEFDILDIDDEELYERVVDAFNQLQAEE